MPRSFTALPATFFALCAGCSYQSYEEIYRESGDPIDGRDIAETFIQSMTPHDLRAAVCRKGCTDAQWRAVDRAYRRFVSASPQERRSDPRFGEFQELYDLIVRYESLQIPYEEVKRRQAQEKAQWAAGGNPDYQPSSFEFHESRARGDKYCELYECDLDLLRKYFYSAWRVYGGLEYMVVEPQRQAARRLGWLLAFLLIVAAGLLLIKRIQRWYRRQMLRHRYRKHQQQAAQQTQEQRQRKEGERRRRQRQDDEPRQRRWQKVRPDGKAQNGPQSRAGKGGAGARAKALELLGLPADFDCATLEERYQVLMAKAGESASRHFKEAFEDAYRLLKQEKGC